MNHLCLFGVTALFIGVAMLAWNTRQGQVVPRSVGMFFTALGCLYLLLLLLCQIGGGRY